MLGKTNGTQRVSADGHHVSRSVIRIALIAALALVVDGGPVSSIPAGASASEATTPTVGATQAASIPVSSSGQILGSTSVVAQTVVPKSTTISEASGRFAWSGRWSLTTYPGYLGLRAKWSNQRGASATFRFTGSRVSWIGPAGPTRGQAKVYLDGRYFKTVNMYSSRFVARRTIFTASWGSQGAHTLRIVVVGTLRHPTVAIDAMVVRSLVSVASPVPPPSPSPSLRVSGPIVITSSNVTIDGVSITSSGKTGMGIVAAGTAGHPVRNITIRNCVIKGFKFGIEVRHAENVTIENCTVTDAEYAGIALYSAVGGRVSRNTVRRIGATRTNMATDVANNAYGITFDRYAGGSLTTDPRSANFMVDHNLVEDVPLWMGINTHAGAHLTFSSNVVRRTPRAIFIAGDSAGNRPIDIHVLGNRLEQPVTKTGGTTNVEGILYSRLQGGSIIGNAVARGYGSPNGFDYQGASTGLTINSNTALP